MIGFGSLARALSQIELGCQKLNDSNFRSHLIPRSRKTKLKGSFQLEEREQDFFQFYCEPKNKENAENSFESIII